MYAIITTEEYKKLLSAEQEGEVYMMEYTKAVTELKDVKEQFFNLLLCITKGAKASQWQDGKFEGFDLADKDAIAGYINRNFMENGRLTIKENNND